MGSFFVFALVSAVICGALGAFVAGLKGVSTSAGIILGALLGPIGLIIVALLTPRPVVVAAPASAVSANFDGERDLTADRYRLWLVEKYGITRNDVMNVFVVDGDPFDSLDAALEYVHGVEAKRHAEATEAARKHQEEQAAAIKRREAALAEERASDSMTMRIILIVVGVLAGAGVLYMLVSSFAAL